MAQYKSSPVGYRHTINHENSSQVIIIISIMIGITIDMTIIFIILIKTGATQPEGNARAAAAKTPNIRHGRTVRCYSSSSHAGFMMPTIMMVIMMMTMTMMMIKAGIVVVGSKIGIKGRICGHH